MSDRLGSRGRDAHGAELDVDRAVHRKGAVRGGSTPSVLIVGVRHKFIRFLMSEQRHPAGFGGDIAGSNVVMPAVRTEKTLAVRRELQSRSFAVLFEVGRQHAERLDVLLAELFAVV